MAERRLGRGLGSLLTGTTDTETGTDTTGTGTPREIEVDKIRPNPHQPRTRFDAGNLEELTASIARHGVLQPIVVRPKGDEYELISGERRLRASRAAGKATIPVTVRADIVDGQMLELALVENLQRSDLDPMERAMGFRELMESMELTQEAVAERVGLKRSTVANHLRLLDLPGAVQDMLAQNLLQMGHARALLGVRGEKACVRLAGEAARKALSVREVERRVRAMNEAADGADKAAAKGAPALPPWASEMQDRIRRHLGTKVTVKNGPDYKGQIVLDYFGREELERLYAMLAPRESL